MSKYKNFFSTGYIQLDLSSNRKQKVGLVPSCVYFSKGDTWLNFLKTKGDIDESKIYKYKLRPGAKAKILELKTKKNVDDTTKLYGMYKKVKVGDVEKDFLLMDWPKIAAKYDGIYVSKALTKPAKTKKDIEWKKQNFYITKFLVETLAMWNNKAFEVELLKHPIQDAP